MAINKKAKKEEKAASQDHEIEVTRAKEFDDCISFDMTVNGVNIYGARYRTYTDKKSKEEKNFVAFPQYKGSNGNYYSHCYFVVSDADLENIEKQIEAIL